MQLIYDQLIPGKPVWDFCCDHGYMGLNAYESGLFPEVHFVDQVPHIIENLRERFLREYFRAEASVTAAFHSQRGEDLQQEVHGSVVIAGVGAFTIFKIIENMHAKELLRAQKLILGPQKDEEKLFQLMQEQQFFGYQFCNEHYTVLERGRLRKLLIFEEHF